MTENVMKARGIPHGFTLLELLVVIVIIGVLATAAVLGMSFTSIDRQLEEEGQRFSALLKYAREEAVLQTREVGLQVGEDGFRFLVLDALANQWTAADFDPVLRPRQFPADIRGRLWIEGAGFDLGDPEGEDVDPGALPQVFILSSGEVSPFELLLESDSTARRVTVTVSLDGTAKVGIEDLGF